MSNVICLYTSFGFKYFASIAEQVSSAWRHIFLFTHYSSDLSFFIAATDFSKAAELASHHPNHVIIVLVSFSTASAHPMSDHLPDFFFKNQYLPKGYRIAMVVTKDENC